MSKIVFNAIQNVSSDQTSLVNNVTLMSRTSSSLINTTTGSTSSTHSIKNIKKVSSTQTNCTTHKKCLINSALLKRKHNSKVSRLVLWNFYLFYILCFFVIIPLFFFIHIKWYCCCLDLFTTCLFSSFVCAFVRCLIFY